MIELWRPIPGYEGFYEAGDLGNIRSVDRRVLWADGSIRLVKGKVLKQSLSGNGYLLVTLCKDKGQIKHSVHSLILTAFKGPRPKDLDGCHNDGNRQNNRLLNLRWDTRPKNCADKKLHGTYQCGEQIPSSKLTEDDIRAIRADSRLHRIVAKDYGVTPSNISCIRRRESWAHVV